MTPLHVVGPERSGGAAAVARSVQALVGGAVYAPSATPIQQAWRTIAGMRSHKAEWEMRWEIRKQRPEVIHLHRFSAIGTVAIAAAWNERVPVVWSCYDYWPFCARDNLCAPDGPCDGRRSCLSCYRPKGGHWPWVANLALVGRRQRILRWLNRLDAVIALSEHSRTLLRAHGVTALIHVVPPPVEVTDEALFTRSLRMRDINELGPPPRIVWAGWLAPNKGVEVFIQACAEVRAVMSGVQCVAFGVVSDPVYAHRMALRADLAGVHLVADTPAEAMPHEALLREVARADVLVCTEQWPNPAALIILEARAMGVTVVAPRIGGIPEFVSDRFLYGPCGNHKELARAILNALNDPTPAPMVMATNDEVRDRILSVYNMVTKGYK